MTTPSFGTFAVTTEISEHRVAGLLCSAFEGGQHGAGYWCRIFGYREPGVKIAYLATLNDPRVCEYADYPLCPGGAVLCYATEGSKGRTDAYYEKPENRDKLLVLDRAAIERGLKLMPTACPGHWGDFLAEQDDANTGDVFVQLCLLGEVRYG